MLLADGAEITKAVAWPAATVVIVLAALLTIKPAILGYIGRVGQVKSPVLEIDTERLEQQLHAVVTHPDESALTSLTQRCIYLGWRLGRIGMMPMDYDLTWQEGEPRVAISKPSPTFRSDRRGPHRS